MYFEGVIYATLKSVILLQTLGCFSRGESWLMSIIEK